MQARSKVKPEPPRPSISPTLRILPYAHLPRCVAFLQSYSSFLELVKHFESVGRPATRLTARGEKLQVQPLQRISALAATNSWTASRARTLMRAWRVTGRCFF